MAPPGGFTSLPDAVVAHLDVAGARLRLDAEFHADRILAPGAPGIAVDVLAGADVVDDLGQVQGSRRDGPVGLEHDELPATAPIGAHPARRILVDVDVVQDPVDG